MAQENTHPESCNPGSLEAQVEALYAHVEQQTSDLNAKPAELAKHPSSETEAGRFALAQLVEMTNEARADIGAQADKIPYEQIASAPGQLRAQINAWQTNHDAVGDEVEAAARQQQIENDQIAAILGRPFEAGRDMILKKMNERAQELGGALPDVTEKTRLETELKAAEALFAVAARPWPVFTVERQLLPPKETTSQDADVPENSTEQVAEEAPKPPEDDVRELVRAKLDTVPPLAPRDLTSPFLNDTQVPDVPRENPGIAPVRDPFKRTEEVAPAPVTKPVERPIVEFVTPDAAQPEEAKKSLPPVNVAIKTFLINNAGRPLIAAQISNEVYGGRETQPKHPEQVIVSYLSPADQRGQRLARKIAEAGYTLKIGTARLPRKTEPNARAQGVVKNVYCVVEEDGKYTLPNDFAGHTITWQK